ncbi:Predicted RNA binding protein YcfA, dsRBD-like fold, HicA-like mRNA interferase family [Desulfacinum infernum DSM 9756]|jgi:predicted RNA binding protein YcfA (HicA-like mRNA interferase family)|uniref:Predicted RNA binding protein YcfA, dsRBD-like fold, HicA-like mRNA interferase family n=1 Tax=Desulfacinum infernum DSM 9756 TaxID=1121391 RepID=A0A1M4ZWK1_9BACT|nr:type II toxin-antitoxin system HicA family toxin [Desulfacinum infernum]SHF22430.1 Predicted RNA binding protein YcfA, dsRBD-like fold, HicA-like mRNA interferase family [Desulfacinum infernum DSM 9756]
MPPLGPIKRRELIKALRELGFSGPYSGGRHQFMVRGDLKLFVPNPHGGEISGALLKRILKQAGISRDEWERV